MTEKLVIIGNGMAPGRMLEHLFEQAPGRYEVTIFNAEPRVNYDRIMLSPVLSGEKDYEQIIIHATVGISSTASRSIRATGSSTSIAPPKPSPPTTALPKATTSW